jgi:hypothetical protein
MGTIAGFVATNALAVAIAIVGVDLPQFRGLVTS